MREELKHCPVCEATSFEEAVSTVDYSTSKEEFTVQKCTECSHLFTSPRVVEAEIGPYYDNPNYISHTNENKSLFGQVYQVLRGVNLRRKLSYVNAVFTGQGTVLDYGCGTGQFLETLVQSGKNAVGVEINDNARAAAQSFGSVSASIEGVEKGVEVITMWHVLEHIYDLNGLLSTSKKDYFLGVTSLLRFRTLRVMMPSIMVNIGRLGMYRFMRTTSQRRAFLSCWVTMVLTCKKSSQ